MLENCRPERLRVLDAPVDLVNMDQALEFVDRYIRNADKAGYILAVNPEKVYALRENEFLRHLFNNAALLIPDGIGMVIALLFLHRQKVCRVPGADLMLKICERSAEAGYRIFIFGSSEEVNKGAVLKLQRRYPGIHIVGRSNGYRKPEEMEQLINDINRSGADILFVALGSPRQEEWIQRNLSSLNVKIIQGIGGTLDTITGRVKRAPVFFQKMGLEWLYRLLMQPSRIKRQLCYPIFVFEVILLKLRGK